MRLHRKSNSKLKDKSERVERKLSMKTKTENRGGKLHWQLLNADLKFQSNKIKDEKINKKKGQRIKYSKPNICN